MKALAAAMLALPLLLAGPTERSEASSPMAGEAARDPKAVAQGALEAARSVLGPHATAHPEAQSELAEAEQRFAEGKYDEAARAADRAWERVTGASRKSSSFSVEVSEAGDTQVATRTGQPVRVEAQGVQRPVGPGERVRVTRGQPPGPVLRPPPQPLLASPRHKAKLRLKPDEKGQLGPVKLAWRKAAGASSYEVTVSPEKGRGGPYTFATQQPQLQLPALPPGRYGWTVVAAGQEELRSAAAGPWTFELEEDPLKLEVKGTKWE
jgi:hypothetical protein